MLRTLALSLALLTLIVSAKRLYDNGEQILIQVNNARPFNNPAETYDFYKLPFCSPKNEISEHGGFGDAIAGDRRKNSPYEIFFRTPVVFQRLCKLSLTQDQIKELIHAIDEEYVFEMFVDGLPVTGFVGEKQESVETFSDHQHNSTRYFLYTHLVFSLTFHSEAPHEVGSVISANITTTRSRRVELVMGNDIVVDYSFSAKWSQTDVTYGNRLSLHQKSLLDAESVEIHWLSIINSFVLVILLTTFLAIILMKVLKNDFARYVDSDVDELASEIDDSGWKQVHGDVFRFPEYPMALSACLGAGVQLLVLLGSLLTLAMFGLYYPGNRSALLTAGVFIYAFTSGIAGYFSTTMYIQLGGTKWATNVMATALVFAGPFITIFAVVNTVAISYSSNSALPFRFIALLVALWALVTLPLTVFGAMKAKSTKAGINAPCKTNFVRREIPAVPWYRQAPVQVFMAGFLPFSAIYIELHYTFAAIWGNSAYTLFGILAIAFLLVLIVTTFITIALTYFQLAVEDYRWWWRSFLSGGSAGVFIFGYSLFYFVYRANMTGTLQCVFFFGYVSLLSYALFLILGTVGFLASRWFVFRIYQSIKSD